MDQTGIVLAAFGAMRPEALEDIAQVLSRVRAAFPGCLVSLAFTSNQIRARWRERSLDQAWRGAHPGVMSEVWGVRGILGAVADLQEAGHRDIIVQPLHIQAGEEFEDLGAYVRGLASIRTVKPRWKPFRRLVLGRPALGCPGPWFPYQRDLERAAQALTQDVARAACLGAALVYAGHGNPHFPSGMYKELELCLRRAHPGVTVVVGLVEGMLSLKYVQERLARLAAKRVLLKPLMLVAGQHAHHDLAGDAPDSWRGALESQGLAVECDLRGLGQNPAWVEIYVENIRQAAQAHEIKL